jgi:CelD/BcsL family acetyltransferase involved in cellulose biosynthesis
MLTLHSPKSSQVTAEVFPDFDCPDLSPTVWARLLRLGETDAVNLTWHWQRSWWKAFGRGQLLLIGARRGDELVALAPLFSDGGMIFNLCPEDMLDFVGDISDAAVLDAILNAARDRVEGFLGFRFYFMPDTSRSGNRLQQAARRLGLRCIREESLPCPWLDIDGQPEVAQACIRKRSLVRHERWFRREGDVHVECLVAAAEVLQHMDDFFQQHVARRAATPHPSLFVEARQRDYYRELTQVAASQGWLRFTRVLWNGKPIGHHFGLAYHGRYLWGIPTFNIELARFSPGEVVLRQVLLQAICEGAARFDFGPGDESYKRRFSTNVTNLETWGLYPVETERRTP